MIPAGATGVLATVLLTAGVLAVLVAAVGLLAGGTLFDRLHYLTPASSLGVPLVVAALAVEQPHPGRATVKLVLVGLVLMLGGPVVTVATARALTDQIDQIGQPAEPARQPERPDGPGAGADQPQGRT